MFWTPPSENRTSYDQDLFEATSVDDEAIYIVARDPRDLVGVFSCACSCS